MAIGGGGTAGSVRLAVEQAGDVGEGAGDELLADPMVRLFMASDGITEDEMRRLYSRRPPGPVSR